jgi:hypothetical protein
VGAGHAFDYLESVRRRQKRWAEGHSSYDKAILIAFKPRWTIA